MYAKCIKISIVVLCLVVMAQAILGVERMQTQLHPANTIPPMEVGANEKIPLDGFLKMLEQSPNWTETDINEANIAAYVYWLQRMSFSCPSVNNKFQLVLDQIWNKYNLYEWKYGIPGREKEDKTRRDMTEVLKFFWEQVLHYGEAMKNTHDEHMASQFNPYKR